MRSFAHHFGVKTPRIYPNLSMNSMKLVILSHFIWWNKDSKRFCDTTTLESIAELRLLSSLVWIDQYNDCNGMTSFMEFITGLAHRYERSIVSPCTVLVYTNNSCVYINTTWFVWFPVSDKRTICIRESALWSRCFVYLLESMGDWKHSQNTG